MQQNDAFNAANSSPALADFNHDGKLDAAFGALANAYVLNGHGDGLDSTGTVLPIPSIAGTTSVGTLAVVAGDFDALAIRNEPSCTELLKLCRSTQTTGLLSLITQW